MNLHFPFRESLLNSFLILYMFCALLTCADIVNGFITAFHANSIPLIGAVQIMSGNER